MQHAPLARYLNPWKYKREQEELQRIAELRSRDGECCRRCRRSIRFEFPSGHEQAPKIHHAAATVEGQPVALDDLCLVHTRCNAAGADNTVEVKQRVQRKNEAALLSRKRSTAA